VEGKSEEKKKKKNPRQKKKNVEGLSDSGRKGKEADAPPSSKRSQEKIKRRRKGIQ